MNCIFSLISSMACLSLMHMKVLLIIYIKYPASLLKVFISSNRSPPMEALGSFMYLILSSTSSETLT